MDFNKLEQAGKIVKRIKELDTEIAGIEKYAMQVANDEAVMNLALSIKDLTKPETTTVLDAEYEGNGLISFAAYDFSHLLSRYKKAAAPINNTTDYSQDISNNAALQILGVLLCEKITRRESLLSQLQGMGITVNQ